MYMAKIQALQLKVDAMQQILLDDNSWIKNSIVERLENSLDLHSVGGNGYGLSKAISNKLDQLTTKLTSPIAQLQNLPHDSNQSTLAQDITDTFGCDVLEEEEDIVFTVEIDERLQENARDAPICQ